MHVCLRLDPYFMAIVEYMLILSSCVFVGYQGFYFKQTIPTCWAGSEKTKPIHING